MLRVSVSVLLLLGAISALAQDVYYTLGEALSRVENTSEYLQEMRETLLSNLLIKLSILRSYPKSVFMHPCQVMKSQ